MVTSRFPLPSAARAGRGLAALALALGTLLIGTAASACPDWRLTGQQIAFSGAQLGAPQTLPVNAGGNVNLGQCSQLPGQGYLMDQPNFDLSLAGMGAGSTLQLQVTASCDTVLLVNDWSGRWHFDDDTAGNLNPRVTISGAQDGAYDIWVGTYGPAGCAATLTIQASGSGVPPSPPQPPSPPPPPVPPQPTQTTCPPGQVFMNGVCITAPMPTCPAGFEFVNGMCMPAQQPVCPQGYVFMNGICQPSNQPVCPQGYVFMNGICQPTGLPGQPTGQQSGQQPGGGSADCPPGQQRILGVCQDPGGTPVN